MAIIYNTTMSPGKLDLLRVWLPTQPWYLTSGRGPDLAKVGGFRLDDPAGEVGIEFMVVTDGSGPGAVTYQVPLTYRADAIAAAEGGLIGTAEHGVLGRRWIYDGACDRVLVAQLVALIQGRAEPQAQSVSGTPDPTVIGWPVANGPWRWLDRWWRPVGRLAPIFGSGAPTRTACGTASSWCGSTGSSRMATAPPHPPVPGSHACPRPGGVQTVPRSGGSSPPRGTCRSKRHGRKDEHRHSS
jgi:maltokinase-like protein